MRSLTLNKAKTTLVTGALLLSQTVLVAPIPVLALDNQVRIAGAPLFDIRGSVGGLTPEKRAETIQNNLDNALVAAKDRTPSTINITYVKGAPVITLGGYQVVTVDSATAKAFNTTPALLAKKWADSIREHLVDQASVESYVAQLSGNYSASAPAVVNSAATTNNTPQQAFGGGGFGNQPVNYGGPPQGGFGGPAQGGYGGPGAGAYVQPGAYGGPGPNGYRQGRVAYAPAGLVIPISLQTAISTQVAKAGDMIQATVTETMQLGEASLPSGTVVMGTITDADPGKRLSRSGSLSVKFNRLRTPDGIETPISAHLIGGIGKYSGTAQDSGDSMRGEGWKAKVGQTAIRGGVGAGAGAALGTAIGAIAGRSGAGVGRGAWSGAAIGGGVGAASMLMRKGRDVTIQSGTRMELQLDAPASLAGGGGGYTGNL